MNNIITYFYIEDKDNRSKYGVQESNYEKKNEYYFRCIVNFFMSSLYYNKNSKHFFITNDIKNLNFIQNLDFYKFCKDNNINIIQRKSKHVSKQEKWAGSMYFFDAIEYFAEQDNINQNDNFIFFDNDIFFNSNIDAIFSTVNNYSYMLYNIEHEYKEDNKWVGNFNDLKKDYLTNYFTPYGGEFFAIKGKKLIEFMNCYYKHNSNKELKTEEHYLSYIFSNLINKNEFKICNDYLKRCWTTYKHNNIANDDYKKAIIHVPSEKEYGLYWYSSLAIKKNKYEPDVILKYCGIKKRPINIQIKRILKKIKSKIYI